jgi:S-adenosylmethionine-diacylgycerolhomoserine-N-methlytransferase
LVGFFLFFQATGYDEFRKRLLHGREEMIALTPQIKDGVWIDMGGGTGSNVEEMDRQGRLKNFKKVYIVDLSSSLLKVARERIAQRGWSNVEAVEADATTFKPAEFGRVDLVTFSYSLTMIPDWFLAMEHARNLLRVGGHIGIVDFYVSRKYPSTLCSQNRSPPPPPILLTLVILFDL